jgi:dihydrofolate reductase
MGQLVVHINVSIDGFINDREGGLQWWRADDEFNRYIDSFLDSIDGMILGRRAYDALAQFWPSAGAEMSATQRRRMHELPKYLLSHTEPTVAWHNTHVLGPDPVAAINELTQDTARDIAVFAGAQAATSTLAFGLVDELRLVVHPELVGSGTHLFDGGYPAQPLQLTDSQNLKSGVVILRYAPTPAVPA